MISGRVPVRLLLAALLAVAATMVVPPLAWAKPATPTVRGLDPTGPYDVAAPYYGTIFFDAIKPLGTTLVVLDPDGNELDYTVPQSETNTSVNCFITDYYDSASIEGTIQTFAVVARATITDESDPVFVRVKFGESRLKITTPSALPAADAIALEGQREEGGNHSIQWTLKQGSRELFDAPRLCGTLGDPDEGDAFSCPYDSTAPPPQAGGASGPLPSTTVQPAVYRPGAFALPAIVPNGSYTATFNEYKVGIVAPIDTISFTFTVGPIPAPGGGGGIDDETLRAAPIPLAPLEVEATPSPDPEQTPAPDETPPADETPQALPPLPSPTDDDVLRILILAIIAFTVMAMSGARGMGAPRRLTESPVAIGPQIGLHRSIDLVGPAETSSATHLGGLAAFGGAGLDGADDDAGRARPFGDAWGDRSITWRFPGWMRLDALSFAAPVWLAPRLPLVSRIGADGAYLRSALGVLWGLLPIAGLVLGAIASFSGGAAPLPPALGLVATMLVLAVLDASAGIAAVTAFTVVTLARGGLTAEGLTLGEGVRGLIGLAALWFVAPLVAAAARPLRRAAEPDHVYSWDRFGDTVIAALVSGWAVQGIVGSLGDLTGRDLAISSHADGLALLTIGAVIGRFLLEEAAAVLYPRRLQAVQEHGELPEPSRLQQVRALVFRAGLLAFFAGAFLGNCWQLWLGVAIFAVPQILQLMGDRIPDVTPITSAVPRGVVQTLVLVLVGTAIAYLVDAHGSKDELTAIRQGFVLLAIPGAALEVLSVFGGDAPKPKWTWPKQLAGAVVVALTAGLVLFLL